jgi:undecaprenyl diphosphate synthase
MQSIPNAGLHVAIVMDGNGRWAARRGLPRLAGHRAGVAALRKIVERASDVGIRRLTVYAFSADNWKRPAAEVAGVFWLCRAFLRLETARLQARGVRLQVIGRRDRLAHSVLREIDKAELATANGRGLRLCVAIDYSSRESIARAALSAMEASRGSRHSPSLCAVSLANVLAEQADDVDLLIRAGGEQRLSDFLLWESAYAELYFTDRMWPDFNEADFDAALQDFRRRQRRFGGIPIDPVASPAPALQ